MFDDQTKPPAGAVPGNLPVADPEDMFQDSAPIESEPVNRPPEIIPPKSVPGALDAGVLQRKTAPASELKMESIEQPGVTEGLRPEEDMLRAPLGGRKVLLTVLIIVSLAIVGGGGLWIYFSFIAPKPLQPAVPQETVTKPENKIPEKQPVSVPETVPASGDTVKQNSATSTDERILFGEPVLDTDSDGLDDSTENTLGTKMLEWDSDRDNLSDGDEVLTWKTNPLSPDTDNDGYPDGEEIKNGYNPKGTGKLFPINPATSTEEK